VLRFGLEKALNCAAMIRAGGERPGERTANEVSSGWHGGQLRQHAFHGRLVGTGEWRGVWEQLQVGEQLLGQAAGVDAITDARGGFHGNLL
jgi:hypothetical protein